MENKEEPVLYALVSNTALKKMGGNRGKLGAQVGHGFLHAFWNAEKFYPDLAKAYKEAKHAKKVVLICEDELMDKIYLDYQDKCGTTKIIDAGFTVFNEPTFTVVGIGPIYPSMRDDNLKNLKVLL